MKLFKPEDFETDVSLLKQGHGDIPYISTPLASNIANNKLKEWLDAATVVYGRGNQWDITDDKPDSYLGCTHSAKLVCIEEIKRDCKHEPLEEVKHTVCKHCGLHLDAVWRVI